MSRNAVMFSSDVLSTVHARHVKKESLSVIADSLCVAHSTLRKQLSLGASITTSVVLAYRLSSASLPLCMLSG